MPIVDANCETLDKTLQSTRPCYGERERGRESVWTMRWGEIAASAGSEGKHEGGLGYLIKLKSL